MVSIKSVLFPYSSLYRPAGAHIRSTPIMFRINYIISARAVTFKENRNPGICFITKFWDTTIEVVSKPRIRFESKAQPDEKAQHTPKYVSILKRASTQLSGLRWGFETASSVVSCKYVTKGGHSTPPGARQNGGVKRLKLEMLKLVGCVH